MGEVDNSVVIPLDSTFAGAPSGMLVVVALVALVIVVNGSEVANVGGSTC